MGMRTREGETRGHLNRERKRGWNANTIWTVERRMHAGKWGRAWEFECELTDGTKWQLQFPKSALGETWRKRKEERRLARKKEKIKERRKRKMDRKKTKSIESVVHLFNWQFWVWRAAESPVSPDGPSQSSGRTDVPWSLSLRPLLHQDAWLGALSGAWVRVKKKKVGESGRKVLWLSWDTGESQQWSR